MKRRTFMLATSASVATASVLSVSSARASSGARVIRFGQSASLTGGQAAYGRDVQNGIAAAFAAATANEASTGVRFELMTLDDGGVRSRCMSQRARTRGHRKQSHPLTSALLLQTAACQVRRSAPRAS